MNTLTYARRTASIPHSCARCAGPINPGDTHLAVRIHRGAGRVQNMSVCVRCAGALATGRGREGAA